MTFDQPAGEPWTSKDDMFEIDSAPQLDLLPVRAAISRDKRCVQFYDDVDCYHHTEMTKAQVADLAEELRRLADAMEG